MLTEAEWADALLPLWKEYFASEDDVDLVKSDFLGPLLQFHALLRDCRQPDGFLAHVRPSILGAPSSCLMLLARSTSWRRRS